MLRPAIFCVFFLALAGCVPTNVNAVHEDQPSKTSTDGTYVNAASGMRFPSAVGAFKRNDIHRFDDKGLDESAGYKISLPNGSIIATVYIYRSQPIASFGSSQQTIEKARQMMLEKEFEARKEEITSGHQDARFLTSKPAKLVQPGLDVAGLEAVFRFTDMLDARSQKLQSNFYLFSYIDNDWTLAYRFSYPETMDAGDKINSFMQELSVTIGKK